MRPAMPSHKSYRGIALATSSVSAFLAQLYLLLAVIVVVKHHANIARLLKGQESKVSMGGARS